MGPSRLCMKETNLNRYKYTAAAVSVRATIVAASTRMSVCCQ